MVRHTVAFLLALLATPSASGATHETRSVRFAYPDTFHHSMEGNTLLFTGPSDQRLRVSVIVVAPDRDDALPLDGTLTEMRPRMERFGSRRGFVFVRPV